MEHFAIPSARITSMEWVLCAGRTVPVPSVMMGLSATSQSLMVGVLATRARVSVRRRRVKVTARRMDSCIIPSATIVSTTSDAASVRLTALRI